MMMMTRRWVARGILLLPISARLTNVVSPIMRKTYCWKPIKVREIYTDYKPKTWFDFFYH